MIDTVSYSQMRIMETAQSFRRLNSIYEDSAGEDDVVCAQLSEVAGLLEEAAGVGLRAVTPDAGTGRAVKRAAASAGVRVESVMFFQKRNGTSELSVIARSLRHGCVKAAELAAVLTEYLGKEYVPSKGGRGVITDKESEFIFEEAPAFFTLFGQASVSKDEDIVSGDSYTYLSGCGGRAYAALADGMGTGNVARRTSGDAIELFEQLMQTGFGEKTAFRLINAAFSSRNDDNPVTLDCAGVDLITGACNIVKLGAASSFVRQSKSVTVIRPSSLPAGVLAEAKPDTQELELTDKSYVVLVSDGVLDALPFYDKELQFAKILESLREENPKAMAEKLMEEVLFYPRDQYRDDMTVLVLGVWKNR
ncbi:MAG: SpoIIE family protein phosphatase [Butyrivibrio sp.]|nr:SpoIIE family protein phosphatase [Butyrivibrio sp.]